MDEEKIESLEVFRPDDNWARKRDANRRFKWVEIDGKRLCVWANMVSEGLKISTASTRPPELQGLGVIDENEVIIQQVMSACHDGAPPTGNRIYNEGNRHLIGYLMMDELSRITSALSEVNGIEGVGDAMEDFTSRPVGEPSVPLLTSVSRNSTGSPVS